MIEITSLDTPPSLARTLPSSRPALRIGVVQHRWHPDAAALHAELDEGIGRAARLGASRRLPPRAHAVPLPRGHASRK